MWPVRRDSEPFLVFSVLLAGAESMAPVSDLFGTTGRHCQSRQGLPADERASVQAPLRHLDFHAASWPPSTGSSPSRHSPIRSSRG